MPQPREMTRLSVAGLRRLVIGVLVVSVLAFTTGVFVMVQRIFDNFGPSVREDLIWKTVRGARELARAADLGLATSDEKLMRAAFAEYGGSKDIVAIVAEAAGPVTKVVIDGHSPEPPSTLFVGEPGTLRETPQYFISWTDSVIEGAQVGRIALIVSKQRLSESQALLRRVEFTTGLAGLISLFGGILFVTFATKAIARRDRQLAEHAATLEKKVADRTRELDDRNRGMRLVLDHTATGFITISTTGVMEAERSGVVDVWFGVPAVGMRLRDFFQQIDPVASNWLRVGMEAIADDLLPHDLLIDQLPKRMTMGSRTYQMDYTPILRGDAMDKILVVISEITSDLVREAMEANQRELVHIFQSITADRGGFEEFLREARGIVQALVSASPAAAVTSERRLVHTLKGITGIYRLASVAQACHAVETRMLDGVALTASDRAVIGAAWESVEDRLRTLQVDQGREVIEIEKREYQRLLDQLAAGSPLREIGRILHSWQWEPVGVRLGRLASQAQELAKRLEKAPVRISVHPSSLRLDVNRYGFFFAALTHVVANALDHGIESAERRQASGKPSEGHLQLSCQMEKGNLLVCVRDDGAGIDWARLGEKARERGLPAATPQDLQAALFADGVSTRDAVSLVSGRGIGMAAVRAALGDLGGTVVVSSKPGVGSTFEFQIPCDETSVYLPRPDLPVHVETGFHKAIAS